MYVPLRVRTHSSVGHSTLTPSVVADWARATGIPAVGVCETQSFAGALETAKALKGAGIQPLTGITLRVALGDVAGDLVAFARSQAGYEALLRASNAQAMAQKTGPLAMDTLLAHLDGVAQEVVVLTGGRAGLGALAPQALLEALAGLPYVFAEIERTDTGPHASEAALIAAAVEHNRPLVATTPMVCAGADAELAHEVYLGIAAKTVLVDPARPRLERGAWLTDAARMRARFADMPEAVDATLTVARLCGWMIKGAAPSMPRYPFVADEDAALLDQARAGLSARIATAQRRDPHFDAQAYGPRLEHELALIQKMGFSGYFLIVADFIAWARSNGIPVGPGRGSGAGSLVAYALGITNIDPLPFGLLFERFLNPDRVSLPDFDIDFGQARRDEVIAYVRQRYGQDQVAQIGTWAVLQARAAVKAVGRVLGVPYTVADRFAGMIPQNPTNPISLQEAMESGALKAELAQADESVRTMFAVAIQLEGLYSHMSTHAAGVVIASSPLAGQVPLHRDDRGMLVTTFGMKAVEASGLVKFDFLGLKNLDIIAEALDFVEQMDGQRPDLDALNYEDSATYAMLARGDGFGVFQVESAGMRRAMRALQVDSIRDFIALISLYRPGPMDQIETYAAVKHGLDEPDYPHPACKEALAETHGVIVYQEQVMQIARTLAGYSLGEADLLRRAMGKKIQSEMEEQRARFTQGASAGWVRVETSDGRSVVLHAHSRVALSDGSGLVSLQDALDRNLDVAI